MLESISAVMRTHLHIRVYEAALLMVFCARRTSPYSAFAKVLQQRLVRITHSFAGARVLISKVVHLVRLEICSTHTPRKNMAAPSLTKSG